MEGFLIAGFCAELSRMQPRVRSQRARYCAQVSGACRPITTLLTDNCSSLLRTGESGTVWRRLMGELLHAGGLLT